MRDLTEARDLYRGHFARFETELTKNGQSWTYPIRKEAIARFAELGFPTIRDEDWKYTNVAPIVQVPFRPARYEPGQVKTDLLATVGFGKLSEFRLAFVNGQYSKELSSLRHLPEGMKVESLAAAISFEASSVEPHLGRYANYRNHTFIALNTALMRDGALIYVPAGKVIEEPIHLLFISTTAGDATVSHPRNLIVIGAGSQATIIESYLGLKGERYFTNAVTELVVGDNAVVDHYKLEVESEEAFQIATLEVRQERNSNFSSHSITLGGSLTRNEVNATLDGEGAECALNGLYMVSGKQHVDNHTRIDHVKPHCTSRELYKGILDGKSRGIFNGKIYVHKAAEKTDAKQTNKNLLLSGEASVDTKPQLEIYNNDVKCTHGSTIGQLDQDAVFYCRSRGIDQETARSLLTYAFASEMIGRIKVDAIRSELDALLVTKFKGKAMKERI
jgi:Fe-S cluster assembly protein SufD